MIPDKMRFHTVPVNPETLGIQVEYLRAKARSGMALTSIAPRLGLFGFDMPFLDVELPDVLLEQRAREDLARHNDIDFSNDPGRDSDILLGIVGTNNNLAPSLRLPHIDERSIAAQNSDFVDFIQLCLADLSGLVSF